jgi:hypothetical protein
MPKKVTGGAGSVSLKPTKRKFRSEPSPEELARRHEDRVFEIRDKFRRWAWSADGLYRHEYQPLLHVYSDDEEEGLEEEGLLDPEEFALVPMRDLRDALLQLGSFREMLDHMEQTLEAAMDTRTDEE